MATSELLSGTRVRINGPGLAAAPQTGQGHDDQPIDIRSSIDEFWVERFTASADIKVFSGDWRSWLPGFLEYNAKSLLEQGVFIYAICILGLCVGLGLLSHLFALLVGYRRVDTAVDRTLSVSVVLIAAILRWSLRLLTRAIKSQRCSSGNR